MTRPGDMGKVLFTREECMEAIAALGRRLGEDYADKHMLMIGVLKGGFMFTADLARAVTPVPPILEVDFLKASSYGTAMESSGTVKLDDGFDLSAVKDKHVLVVDEMVDSGLTLEAIAEMLRDEGAASVKVCTFLNKVHDRKKTVFRPDYVGLECPDEFVVGYGNDFMEMYRFLPYVGVLTSEGFDRLKTERLAFEQLQKQG